MSVELPTRTDVLVVGAGPAGSSAATWLARAGKDVALVDAATFPRDKTCGDGLTPRAINELIKLGQAEWLRGRTVNLGLRAHGFGVTIEMPWPGGSLPNWGSAVARTELDAHLRSLAIEAGAVAVDGKRAVDVERDGVTVSAVLFDDGTRIECRRLVVADGVRSPLGKVLGREWHRNTVYGVAGRSYVKAEASTDDPWISSHLELRDAEHKVLSGYGWVFPLGTGEVNLGAGTLATAKRPADVAIKPLMRLYAASIRDDFGIVGDLRDEASALLPMGGAVSGVCGDNWTLIGDAAACVNPLNGEGIDYGMETGRLVAEVIADGDDLSQWSALLRSHYGETFSIARRLAALVTVPGVLKYAGPVGMRSQWLMTLALRYMGNLVTDADRDAAARVWRWAGKQSLRLDHQPLWDN